LVLGTIRAAVQVLAKIGLGFTLTWMVLDGERPNGVASPKISL